MFLVFQIMEDNKIIITNKNFRLILNRTKTKILPKKIDAKEFIFYCSIEPINADKILLDDENLSFLRKALLKLLNVIKKEFKDDRNTTYYGGLGVSFQNLKKKWIRSDVKSINSALAKNIVYNTMNKIGELF